MARQLSLNIGGATVDTCKLGSITFAKDVAELDGQDFNKGDDVVITVRCRLHGGKIVDVYDSHGNVKETIKTLIPKATDVIECRLDTPGAYKAAQESEDDAVSQAGIQAGNDARENGRVTTDEELAEQAERIKAAAQDGGEADDPEPAQDPEPSHLASV